MTTEEKVEIQIIEGPLPPVDTLLAKQGFYRFFEINTKIISGNAD